MLRVDSAQQRTANVRSLAKNPDVASLFPAREATGVGDTRMTDVSTPLSLSGFTAAAVDQFSPQMRKLSWNRARAFQPAAHRKTAWATRPDCSQAP